MKKFKIEVDATFEAEDIDDAFEKLSHHFKMLSSFDDYDEEFLLAGSKLEIYVVE